MMLNITGINHVMLLVIIVTSIHSMSAFTNFRLNQNLGVMRKPTFQGKIAPGLIALMRNVFRKTVTEKQVNERIKKFKAKQQQKKSRQQSNLERTMGTSFLTQNDFPRTESGSDFIH